MADSSTGLTVISPYGAGLAGYRARVGVWAERLDLSLDEHCYFGRSGTAASFTPRSLPESLRAERALRRLRRHGSPALLMHREASPFSTGKLEADLLTAADRSAYDIDDALYADWGDDRLLRRLFAKAGKAAAAVERASITLVGNETIAEWASTISDDVRIVPTCVAPADYDRKTDYELGKRPQAVWIGSPSTIRHLRHIEEPLLRLHRDLDAELIVIGGSVQGTPLEAMSQTVEWSPENQRRLLAEADIGLMPLEDGPFERGKCGYKLLQYAAAGLPAVASPVGVNATMIDQFDALGPAHVDDWYDGLRALFTESPDERRSRADNGRAAVQALYSFDAWEPMWREVVDELTA